MATRTLHRWFWCIEACVRLYLNTLFLHLTPPGVTSCMLTHIRKRIFAHIRHRDALYECEYAYTFEYTARFVRG